MLDIQAALGAALGGGAEVVAAAWALASLAAGAAPQERAGIGADEESAQKGQGEKGCPVGEGEIMALGAITLVKVFLCPIREAANPLDV